MRTFREWGWIARRGVCVAALLLLVACASRTVPTRGIDPPSIVWDAGTLRRVSSAMTREGYNGYARLIQRREASLLCAYEADGRVVVVSSHDLGNSWSEPRTAADAEPGLCMATPDLIALQDGTILLCFNPRPCPPAPGKRFAIRTKRSRDGGLTWGEECLVYEAGERFEDGCWEPAAIALPGGEVRLFFANEGVYTESAEQNISMVRSTDGGLSWSGVPEIVSFRPGFRDGMPSPLFIEESERFVIAIEDNGSGNFAPFMIEGAERRRVHEVALPVGVYAGAPCLRRLSSGETILSYQGGEGRRGDLARAEMKVMIGDGGARDFRATAIPFDIPKDRAGLWNSLAVLDDDTIIALTSTDAWSPGEVEVWMIKGRMGRE